MLVTRHIITHIKIEMFWSLARAGLECVLLLIQQLVARDTFDKIEYSADMSRGAGSEDTILETKLINWFYNR